MNAIGPNALAGVVKPQHTGKKKSEDPLHMSKFVLDDGRYFMCTVAGQMSGTAGQIFFGKK